MDTISSGDKIQILLKLLDEQVKNIERSEEQEQRLFQWATSLLLAAFGVIMALADKSGVFSSPVIIKLIATTIVVVPVLLSIFWIFRRSQRSVKNAESVVRIEKLLHLFDEQFFGTHSPYPKEWEGGLPDSRRRRKTPTYYALVMAIMTFCVVATIWLVL